MEYYNDILCISGYELIKSDKNPDGLMLRNTYDYYVRTKQIKVVRSGGGYGVPALIEFDSLPKKYRDQWLELHPDTYKEALESPFIEAYHVDAKAADFFRLHVYEHNGNKQHLSDKEEATCTINASVFNAIGIIKQQNASNRKLLGISRTSDFWAIALNALALFHKNGITHTIPMTNKDSLRNKFNKYRDEGYNSLINGNRCNQSSQKITSEIGKWLVAQYMNMVDRLTFDQLYARYNEVAPERGWKSLRSSKTIINYLNRSEVKPIWYAARFGELAYKERYCRQNRTIMPTRRDSLWYGDGTKVNYYYQDELGKACTCYVYEVMDVYSECLLGYFISAKEDYEAQYNAYKMAFQFSGYKPYEIRYDNQGGHKKLEAGDFMNRLTRHAINTAPYNGKSKTIESTFGRFQSQFLHKDWFFTGQNITAKKQESKANMEFILANAHKLPTLDEMKEIYRRRRDEWNAAKHPKENMSRIEMYRNSTNEGIDKVEPLDMVEIFGITTKDTREYTASGIILEIKGKKHPYEVLVADGNPDTEFNRRNIGRKFYRRYCPDDLSIIQLLEESETGPRCIAIAQPYIMVNRALQDQTPEDILNIRYTEKMNKQQRIDAEVERAGILEDHGLHPHQHNLEVAPIKGITSGRKQKKDVGQMLKDVSNTTEMDMVKERRKAIRDAARKERQQAEQDEQRHIEFLRKRTDMYKMEIVNLN